MYDHLAGKTVSPSTFPWEYPLPHDLRQCDPFVRRFAKHCLKRKIVSRSDFFEDIEIERIHCFNDRSFLLQFNIDLAKKVPGQPNAYYIYDSTTVLALGNFFDRKREVSVAPLLFVPCVLYYTKIEEGVSQKDVTVNKTLDVWEELPRFPHTHLARFDATLWFKDRQEKVDGYPLKKQETVLTRIFRLTIDEFGIAHQMQMPSK